MAIIRTPFANVLTGNRDTPRDKCHPLTGFSTGNDYVNAGMENEPIGLVTSVETVSLTLSDGDHCTRPN